jgi:hypothetical protein
LHLLLTPTQCVVSTGVPVPCTPHPWGAGVLCGWLAHHHTDPQGTEGQRIPGGVLLQVGGAGLTHVGGDPWACQPSGAMIPCIGLHILYTQQAGTSLLCSSECSCSFACMLLL